MRTDLKGVWTSHKRLASGEKRIYYYAWKGGPRLPGAPGDPEFHQAYAAALDEKRADASTLKSVIVRYQDSPDYAGLALRTRRDYDKLIAAIERKFGTFPLAGFADRRCRAVFLQWRDGIAARSPRQADYHYAVLARIVAWGYDRGLIAENPLTRPRKVYRVDRTEAVWTPEDESRLLAVASAEVALAFTLAINTGQRQGDLLRLPWSAWDGSSIRLKQQKRQAAVYVPATDELRKAIDAAPKVATTILANSRGRSWTADGFRSSWDKAKNAAGVDGLTFHDLRGTAVTRLAAAGCTAIEIAAITGHSLAQVNGILDAHYLGGRTALATAAIVKLERQKRTK